MKLFPRFQRRKDTVRVLRQNPMRLFRDTTPLSQHKTLEGCVRAAQSDANTNGQATYRVRVDGGNYVEFEVRPQNLQGRTRIRFRTMPIIMGDSLVRRLAGSENIALAASATPVVGREWEGKVARYVRAGATGTGSGLDWTNAYTNLPANLTRDYVYYVADGSYGSYVFDDPASGTQRIYVVKATQSDHGTDTGWASGYGDGFAEWTEWRFDAPGYYYMDGQVGALASDITGYVEHGFKVLRNGTTANKIFYIGAFGSPCTDITLRHTEGGFTNTPQQQGAWFKNMDVLYNIGTTDLTVQYCWIHDAGRSPMLSSGGSTPNNLIEHTVIEKNSRAQEAENYSPTEHSEVIALQAGCDLTFRYNIIRDWTSTGGIILFDGNELECYGNIFTTDQYTQIAFDANGAINSRSAGANQVANVYNNTFVDIDHACDVLTFGSYTTRNVRNNIFYNVLDGQGGAVVVGGSPEYNWYFGSGSQSEPNIQIGTGDPFVDLANHNYRLSAATDAGDSTIGAAYNTDPDGVTRGADGSWDRGAYEYQS